MVAGVQEMIVRLAQHFPMCTISTGGAPRVDRFLKHYGVRDCFVEVIGAQTTRRMKPHPGSRARHKKSGRCCSCRYVIMKCPDSNALNPAVDAKRFGGSQGSLQRDDR